jgi:hypothetical protein
MRESFVQPFDGFLLFVKRQSAYKLARSLMRYLMKRLLPAILGIFTMATSEPASHSQTIYANDDVYVETSADGTVTTAYNGSVQGPQVVFGLGAANGVASGRRRSFIEFTLGPDPVASATFSIYNYWGANMGGAGNPAGSGSLRLRATPVATPVTITESGTSVDSTWVPPTDAQFTSTINTINVNAVGWWTIDVTAWYNARLGQTTTLQLHGVQVGGFDFPIYEDRENSAFLNGSANTIANAGPRIEITPVPEPATLAVLALGGIGLVYRGRCWSTVSVLSSHRRGSS